MSRKHSDSNTIEREYTPGPVEDPLTLPPGEQFLTKGVLLRNRRNLVACAIILLVIASLLSYFVKPRAPQGDLVSPAQELPGYEAQYPGANELAKRIANSYNLPFVLFQSPYTPTNVQSLENVRSWAHNRFQSAPDFLHPVSIKLEQEPNDTVIGALGYNLVANLRYSLESVVGTFLKSRIADFHTSTAYHSFSESYFEVYGKDAESATLLARYQSDKAKSAIDVILWTIAWAASIGLAAVYISFSPKLQRFDRIRQSLIGTWGLVALGYGTVAWMQNSIPAFVTSLLATVASLYFLNPFVLIRRDDSSLKVFFIQLSSRWIALSVWASYSLLAMLVLTWIRGTLPDNTDPVSLLFSGLSGNFLHDPEEAKRTVARVLGMLWLVVSLWAFLQKDKDASVSDKLEAELKSL